MSKELGLRRLVRRHEGARPTRKEVRQFLGGVTRTEDRATWLQRKSGFEAPGFDGVEAQCIDQLKHRSNSGGIIAGGRHANAAGRALWTPALLELEVAEVVKALYHPR